MEMLQKAVVIAELVNKMKEHGSWCGETHVQKAVFLLQELVKVPTGFAFVLYKHGPFSFDLRDEITEWRVYDLFRWQTHREPYGPSLRTTANAETLQGRFRKTLTKYEKQVDFIAQAVGRRGVAELERLATALLITGRLPDSDAATRARRINELKPHVPVPLALKAVEEIDEIAGRAKEFLKGLPQ